MRADKREHSVSRRSVSSLTDREDRNSLFDLTYKGYKADLLVFDQDLDRELEALEAWIEASGRCACSTEVTRRRELIKEGHRLKDELKILMPRENDEPVGRRRGPRWCWSLYLTGATLLMGVESLILGRGH